MSDFLEHQFLNECMSFRVLNRWGKTPRWVITPKWIITPSYNLYHFASLEHLKLINKLYHVLIFCEQQMEVYSSSKVPVFVNSSLAPRQDFSPLSIDKC